MNEFFLIFVALSLLVSNILLLYVGIVEVIKLQKKNQIPNYFDVTEKDFED